MGEYQKKQLEITKRIEESFRNGHNLSTIVEPASNYVNDNRICLTSVVFIPQDLEKRIIDNITNILQEINPIQYFYIPKSFHVTIQNIRTIENPPLFNNEDIEKVRKVFGGIIHKYSAFTFELKRLFELPTSLAISAFSNEIFGNLVLELREGLEKAGVPDNKTYIDGDAVIANATISRFTNTPNPAFKQKVKELKELEIGSFQVKKISLITTNAVCHPAKTRIIEEYLLKN